jgi:hypothetical protein
METRNKQQFYICSYNNEQLTGTFSEACNSNQNVPRCSIGGYVPLESNMAELSFTPQVLFAIQLIS